MSTIYKDQRAKVVDVLDAYRTGALSDDMTKDVVSVDKGQYMPTGGAAKPCVRVRMQRAATTKVLAGNRRRIERLMFCITGAVSAATAEDAEDEAMVLANNVERILANEDNAAITGYWYTSRLGWTSGEDEESPAPFLEFETDVAATISTCHFKLYWSCDVKFEQEAL